MKIREAFAGGAMIGSGIIGCIVQSTGGVLHLFSAFVAMQVSGFWAGVVTFFLPVVSEIYWLIRLGPSSGYGIIVLAWTGLLVIGFAGMGVAAFFSEE